jgi:hypothetical protein
MRWKIPEMPEESTNLLHKSYSRESQDGFPGKMEMKNRWDPGISGTGNPANETLVKTQKHDNEDLLSFSPTTRKSLNTFNYT